MHYKILIILFFLHSSIGVNAQSDSAKEQIKNGAIWQLVSEFGPIKDINDFKKLIDTTYNVNFLNQSGFGTQVFFIKISPKDISPRISDDKYSSNKILFRCEYVLCYYGATNKYYKIKGFREIDIFELFGHLQIFSQYLIISSILKEKSTEMLNRYLRDKLLYVDRIDLPCIFDYWKSNKTPDYWKTNKMLIPVCLQSCSERDLKQLY